MSSVRRYPPASGGAAPRPGAKIADAAELRRFMAGIADRHRGEPILFLCIGTDRSTGDSLGPWVGTLLRSAGFPPAAVIGTLESPCDADRLPELLASLSADATTIAIDACLGRPEHIGKFAVAEEALEPAKAVGKALPPVGTYSVAGIVGAGGPKPYWTLQTASLRRVLGMALDIAQAAAAEWRPEADLQSWRAIFYNSGSS